MTPSPQHGKEKGNELGYVLAMLLRDMALHLLFEFNLRLYGWCAMTDRLLIDRELLEELRDAANDCLNHAIMRGNDRNVPAYTELVERADAALDAPRQPEGDGLEVVGYGFPNTSLFGKPRMMMLAPEIPSDDQYGGAMWEPLVRLSDAQRAIAELRGLVPELPPRPPEGDGMPRYGLRWNGPRQPVSVPMADGYWTPWHLAEAECEHLKDCQENAMLHMTGLVSERDTLRQQLAELRAQLLAIASAEPRRHTIEWAKAMAATGNNEAYAKWREAFDQRDRLAGLLADVKADYTHAIHWEDMHATMKRIDAALAEVKPCQESQSPAATT